MNRAENTNSESVTNRQRSDIIGPRKGTEFDSKFSNGKPFEDFKQRTDRM